MSNTFTKLRYHVLFSTRGVEPLVTAAVRERLYRYVGGIVGRQQASLLEIGGTPDHLHLLLGTRPDQALADLVRLIKANASKWVRQLEPRLRWQHGYMAFGVSESKVSSVRRYIREQARHHRQMSFADEVGRLLEKHGIEARLDTAPTRTRLRCHIVFATKSRLQLILPGRKDGLYRVIADSAEKERSRILEIGGIADHLHILLDMRPMQSIAKVVKAIKGGSSRWMNGHFPPFAWQRGYGAFTASESLSPKGDRG